MSFSGMPQIESALNGWMTDITIIKIKQNIVDGIPIDSPIEVNFQGTVQPLSPEQLKIKDEGKRSWKWLQIHCPASGLNLATNDLIEYGCKKYVVMDILDYSLNGFIEYHCVENFKNA